MPTCARRSTSASTTAAKALRLAAGSRVDDVPGETNEYRYEPRGVGVVIAPWNFPLAIPAGMVSAALVTGNAVLFKPAEQTPGVGLRLVRGAPRSRGATGRARLPPGPG